MSLHNVGLVSRFKMFTFEHYFPFVLALLFLIAIVKFVYNKPLKVKRQVGLAISIFAVIVNMIFNFTFHAKGDYSNFFPMAAPLWFCGLIAPVAVYGFLKMSKTAFSFVYLISMTGNLVACITPEVHYNFPSVEYISFFTSHALNIVIPFYVISVIPFKMNWFNYITTVIIAHFVVVFSHIINLYYGTNFNYTVSKPTTLTLMDVLGEWPYYLIYTDLIGLAISLIFFLAIKSRSSLK